LDFREIAVGVDGHIATVELNLPEYRNPLTNRMVEELIHAIRTLDEDREVRVIVLTGRGPAFCAGGDIREFRKNLSKPAPQLYDETLWSNQLFELGAEVRTTLIASVNGPALGGGCGLVAMCHLAIASDQAQFGTTELRLGLVPFVILPWIRRAVGEKNALEMMLTAEVFSAERARDMGLVQRVVPHERLREETRKVAEQIASYSPLALRLSLDAFFSTKQMGLKESFNYLGNLRMVSFMSEDLREGATAFMEKRKPVWKGR
jgi:methylglutaconyl-CoA hydratase